MSAAVGGTSVRAHTSNVAHLPQATTKSSCVAPRRAAPGPPQWRWARAVVKILDATEDPKTLRRWARLVGASESSLRAWCRIPSVST